MPRFARLVLVAPLLLLSGCTSLQSTFNAHGPAAHRIAGLSMFMTILFLVVTLIMWVLLAWAFTRRRGSLTQHEPIDASGGQSWIALGGLAIPLIILTVIFVLGLQLLADFPIHGTRAAMHDGMDMSAMSMTTKPDILIVGHQWWWELHYFNSSQDQQFTTANEIHIPINQPITIELETADVMHSFWVPGLHGKVDLIPGFPNYIRLQASDPGNFKGQCAEFCGAQHAHMELLVVAQEPADYQAWLTNQRKPGATPVTDQQRAGQQVFLSGPCAMCHQIRGTLAGGRVAPDLTHIASRQLIASNSFPNNEGYLAAWISHAQSLKPEARMPNLTEIKGQDLNNLMSYLHQLQ